MSYLDNYRQNPYYATSQSQSMIPPAPTFQPQPTWGGLDFYRAVAGQNYDGGLYNHAYGRLQGIGTQSLASIGPSIIEAKLMHRRAYGGLGDIMTMNTMEIGSAAAYEVWRNWRYNYGVLAQPLGGDTMRQREALVGLAIGEASKLWQYTSRGLDNSGRLAAVEAAAIAAAHIFDQGNEILMSGSGSYGMGTGMNMGALSPAIPGMMGAGMAGAAGSILSPIPAATNGMGMGLAGRSRGFGAPPLVRQRSISVGAAPGGYGYGVGGVGGAGGMPGYAGSNAGMYGGTNGMLGGGASGMLGGTSGMLGGGASGMLGGTSGMQGAYSPIPRPLSSGGYSSGAGIEYGAPAEYGPGGLGETGLSRFERHRAERGTLKASRYHDGPSGGYHPSRRAYDDNYEYEYGGGYGNDYGDGYGHGGGHGVSSIFKPGRAHRSRKAARASLGAADTYGYGGGYRDGTW